MIAAIFAIIVGFIVLTWSADQFVEGSAATAKNWGVSPMLIGLTVVSIGTSAPEILVSLISASQDHVDIAVGNAIGSNIANMGLVLGLTALIAPLPVKKTIARQEIPWLLVITVIAGICLVNGYLGLMDSLALLTLLALTLYLMIRWQKNHPDEPLSEEAEIHDLPTTKAWFKLIYGLIFLLISAQGLVWGATKIATQLGIGELVIGLTIVAIGTSLPELAASITSALKGHHDIALGNVVGSNIFNLLAVLSMPGLVAPGALNSSALLRDYPVMLGLTVLTALMAFAGKQPKFIGRFSGLILLGSYCLYGTWLYLQYS